MYQCIQFSLTWSLILDQYCQSVMVNYPGFNIVWNNTLSGVTVESPCVGVGLDGQNCTHT